MDWCHRSTARRRRSGHPRHRLPQRGPPSRSPILGPARLTERDTLEAARPPGDDAPAQPTPGTRGLNATLSRQTARVSCLVRHSSVPADDADPTSEPHTPHTDTPAFRARGRVETTARPSKEITAFRCAH